MKSPNALNWFELFVSDFDRARTFYETILGQPLQVAEMPGSKMAFLPCDMEKGVGGALTQMEGHGPGPGGTLVYLNAEGELDAVVDRIAAAGGTVIRPRFAIPPHGFIALFSDSEGNVVGLHSMS